MAVRITGEAMWSALGDAGTTFAGLLDGRDGVGPLRVGASERLNVANGYHVAHDGEPAALRSSRWLTDVVRAAAEDAGLDTGSQRVWVIVGTGLRELRSIELDALGLDPGHATESLHYGSAVRAALPGVQRVLTISNACSAGGHALALGQDAVELDDADAVVVAGADAMTESMLAMIGRVADGPTARVRPFDDRREGVLLGDGAAAVVLQPDDPAFAASARVRATGLSCDAFHETAPSADGIMRAIVDAYERAGITADEVDVVWAHGTGTALNDPTEASVVAEVFAGLDDPAAVVACKGAIGHTSGTSALHSVIMALHAFRSARLPAIVGLRDPLPEAAGMRLVTRSEDRRTRMAQVNAFGFGGLNSVTILEAMPPEPLA